ncbi:hypothetical protein PR048_004431, partial [Dryococelus australis]
MERVDQPLYKLIKTMENEKYNTYLNRKTVGSLLYLSTTNRPDIVYALCRASQKSCDPTKRDWQD